MANLSNHFPMWKTRKEVEKEIQQNSRLFQTYDSWSTEHQERFLDICTGNRGLIVTYDVYFREIFNPDTNPERLVKLLSVLLKKDVEAIRYLRRESSVLEDEWNLLVLDIVVRLKDGSIVNVEMQKIGYRFPGERACCYSSDLVLRQYRMVKREKERKFSYRDMKPVYTVVLMEKSPEEFHRMPDACIHRFSQSSDTGLELSLLQNYIFVPLDVFRNKLEKEKDRPLTEQEAWLLFLSSDRPEDIKRIIEEHPEFGEIYEQIYAICQDVERMMDMYSEELAMMDRNTVKYMIDELQEKADAETARAEAADKKAKQEAARADEAEAESQKLKNQYDLKNEEEIREMYKAGISAEKISEIKKVNIHEIEVILKRGIKGGNRNGFR